jgi:hypothetical protein
MRLSRTQHTYTYVCYKTLTVKPMPTASSDHIHTPSPHGRRAPAAASVHWQREVPDGIRALGAIDNPDYADIVTATLEETPSGTPEQLIRATLQSVPRSLLLFVPFVQRVFLGLRLNLRPSPDRVLGWRIAVRDEKWVRIEADSWLLTGNVVMRLDEGDIFFATFIRYDHPFAAFVWPPISLIHRQVALILVRSATRLQSQDEHHHA